ncbi:MAG: hypothetical protein ACI9R3_002759 [Verrucomicrobiales bacterium]|jgi:hypothetical protein
MGESANALSALLMRPENEKPGHWNARALAMAIEAIGLKND